MIKLIALNENVQHSLVNCESASLEDDRHRTKFVCDTQKCFGNRDLEKLAEAEYVRALRLISKDKEGYALSILNELLETQLLNEVSSSVSIAKLLNIRHSCYKNAAYIYEKKMDIKNALKYFVCAIQLDDNDVHAMVRLGRLALKGSFFEMAEFVFFKCLKQNINHWMANDAILELLSHEHNILGVYSWALKSLSKEPCYRLAATIISEVNYLFSKEIFFAKAVWIEYPISDINIKFDQENFKCLDWASLNRDLSVKGMFKIPFTNWLSIEKALATKRCDELDGGSIFFILENDYFHTLDGNKLKKIQGKLSPLHKKSICDEPHFLGNDVIQSKTLEIFDARFCDEKRQNISEINNLETPLCHDKITKAHKNKNTPDPPIGLPLNNLKPDGNDNCKSKCRRRCSDLDFLEQWSWHKDRRYSSRRKMQVRSKIEATLKETLDRIFSKYSNTTIYQAWPLDSMEDSIIDEMKQSSCPKCCQNVKSLEDFFIDTQKDFNIFKKSLGERTIDSIVLSFTWLKYISKYWNIHLPKKVLETYYQTCEFYMNHIDDNSWSQFLEEDLKDLYKILLLFLEIEFEIKERESSEINERWKMMYNCLMCNSGTDAIIIDSTYQSNMLRLYNLAYKFTIYENDLKRAEFHLTKLEFFLNFSCSSNDPTFHLPNMTKSCLDRKLISRQKFEIKRKLSLTTIPKLFEAKKWSELVGIISKNITQTRPRIDCQYWTQDLKTQFEIIIESLWSLNDFEACLKWSERFFYLTVTNCLNEVDKSKQHFWIQSINFAIAYIETVVMSKNYPIMDCLGICLYRLVQTIIKILSAQFDKPLDCQKALYDVDFKKSWVILHQIALRDEESTGSLERKSLEPVPLDNEEIEEILPNSFLILFTAHDFLGKRKWCTRGNGQFLQYVLDVLTPTLRAPYHEPYRDVAYEYLEQVTYCLYGFPAKKTRLRHLEDHESPSIELSLSRAMQLFDIYKPECLPEFNSYKLESISSDMEQLLLKTVMFLVTEINTKQATAKLMEYINSDSEKLLGEFDCIKLPYKISSIFYLLADYYFKNRDFSKTIDYYTLDLAHNPNHLDSWAGLALSRASKIECQLNDFLPIETTTFLSECESIIRCFERCRLLNPTHTLLWIEYGSFSYTIYSFCSRHLKQYSPTMSIAEFTHIEKQKEKMLNIAFNCFSSANSLQNKTVNHEKSSKETHDEKWLCRYMLGKITEKRKEQPRVYLNHYLKAAHHLYESNATYPIKINHSSPTPLSVEALEVFYRTNSAMLKFLENEAEIDRETGDLFVNVLKHLSSSPFALNKAKIDGCSLNALKRSLKNKEDEKISQKRTKLDNTFYDKETDVYKETYMDKKNAGKNGLKECSRIKIQNPQQAKSASSESFSDSDADAKNEKIVTVKTGCYSKGELGYVYNELVNNLEECITRFPEHFKSIYRLAFHFMNASSGLQDLNRCENLLLGQYTTGLGNQINGIFADRRNNNIFNGIWRLPSSEIDRPGSFSTHMVKCISILIQMLAKRNHHKLLIDVAIQLYKTPENDKRYIKDLDRIELYQQSIYFCVQIVREILKKNTNFRNNNEIVNILIDIYKAYKKCLRLIMEKEPPFSNLLIEIYSFYIQGKVGGISENCNILDIAIKFCSQEINLRRNHGKSNEDRKINIPQNIPMNINKAVTIPEKDASQKDKSDETSWNPELNTGKIFCLENDFDNPSHIFQSFLKKPYNQFISSPEPKDLSSKILQNDVRYPKFVAECCQMLELNNKEGISSKGFFDSKLDNNSETNLYKNNLQKKTKNSSEISQIVYSRKNTENETKTHCKAIKQDKSMPNSNILNTLLPFSSVNEETILNSYSLVHYQQFKTTNQAEFDVKTISKYGNMNEVLSTEDKDLNSVLNPKECKKISEDKLNNKAKILAGKSKINSRPYERQICSPFNFENAVHRNMERIKNISSYNFGPDELNHQKNSHVKSICSIFKNLPNDQMLQQSITSYNFSNSQDSKDVTLVQTSSNKF